MRSAFMCAGNAFASCGLSLSMKLLNCATGLCSLVAGAFISYLLVIDLSPCDHGKTAHIRRNDLFANSAILNGRSCMGFLETSTGLPRVQPALPDPAAAGMALGRRCFCGSFKHPMRQV